MAFDAYGTLFDVHSVIAAAEELFPGKGELVSRLWREKQLQYTWLHSLMERYEDFWSVTRSALVYALKNQSVGSEAGVIDRLMEQYLHLEPYPEVRDALRALKPRRLVIFSNGSPDMLEGVVKNSGLDELLDGIISVDESRVYKPSPRAYALVSERLAVPASEVLFVSSNAFDAVGAKSFGMRVAWIQRTTGQMEELGIEPDLTVRLLTDLASALDPP